MPSAHNNRFSTPKTQLKPNSNSTVSRLEKYSSLAYRKQAADLMAQIKSDMKGSKRRFSGDVDNTENRKGQDKENDGLEPRERRAYHRATSSTPAAATRTSRHSHTYSQNHTQATAGKQGSSTRKGRLSIADEVDRELAEEMGDMSIVGQPVAVPVTTTVNATAHSTTRIPRSRSPAGACADPTQGRGQQAELLAPPFNSVRQGANDDLNRFVSSSTATSGTTLTAGSAGSFVKHAGPGHVVGNGNIRRIAPEDVQGMLGERVGKMVFDKVMMKWVKAVSVKMVGGTVGDAEGEEERTENTRASTESEDVFRDIESLKEDGDESQVQEGEMSRITETDREQEETEGDDEEEMELTSFSFDSPSAGVVHVMTGVEDMTTDSEDEDDLGVVTETDRHEYDQDIGDGFDSDEELPEALRPPTFSTPRAPQTPLPTWDVIKSKSNTPVSALKNGKHHNRTPGNRGHRRSVSFSDGKRDGPIRGMGRNAGANGRECAQVGDPMFVPSVRSKRIADMMEDLESQGMCRGMRYFRH